MASKNWILFFIKQNLKQKGIPSDKISFEEVDDHAAIWMARLFYPENATQGIELLWYINNLLEQFHAPLYHMQIEKSSGPSKREVVDQVALIFNKKDFDDVNQRINDMFGKDGSQS